MARPLVPDELWEIIEPLLPRHKARPGKRGRPPVEDRACLTGIIFVLRSGIPWEMLPLEMGCGSGVTCWRRLRYWQRRGVWKKLLHAMLDRLGVLYLALIALSVGSCRIGVPSGHVGFTANLAIACRRCAVGLRGLPRSLDDFSRTPPLPRTSPRSYTYRFSREHRANMAGQQWFYRNDDDWHTFAEQL